MKILVADDDPDDRLLFRLAFKEAFPGDEGKKIQLEFAKDGEELLDCLNEKKEGMLPDLIFLDLNMPRKNGREALKEIKSDPQLKNIDVIMLSTSSSPGDKTFSHQNGAKAYLEKPFDFDKWREMIRVVCQEKMRESSL